jgi:cell division protein FtsQ
MSARADLRPASSRANGPAPPPRRRTPVAPPVPRRRRRFLVVAAGLALLLLLAWGASISPLLDVETVTVRGTKRLTAAQVEDAGDLHEGDAMLWLDPGKVVAGIESLPYVERATVTREWPDTVRVSVRERRPVAWAKGPTGAVLVDRTGRVLEAVDEPPASTAELLGAKVVPPPGGSIDPTGAARVAGGLHGLAALGTASVEESDHGVVVKLRSGPEIRMGTPTQVGVKLRAAFAVLAASEGTPVAYVDVSVPTNPVAG